MISGYLSSKQDLVDLLNGCLFNRVGTLDLFLGVKVVSLYTDKGLIRGFKLSDSEEVNSQNKRSILLYHLSEFMENPKAFFTFREGQREKIFELEESVSVEELVLQLQLVHSELKSLMERVITPMAVVKVIKNFEEAEFYNSKSIYQILVSSNNSLVEEIRKLKSLFSSGYLDINQFYNPELLKEEIKIEYLMKGVEAERVNLITLLDSFHFSKFSGIIQIIGGDFEFDLYYKKGRLSAVYPYNSEIFDFFLTAKNNSVLNVIDIGGGIIDLLMLKHSEEKAVSGLSGSFLEVGKMLIGMSTEGRSGMITIYSEGSKTYIIYREGLLLGIIEDGMEGLKFVKSLPVEKVAWVDIALYQPMENIRDVIHQFLLNAIYSILLKHAGHLNHIILSQLASSDVLKYNEGVIVYRRKPKGEEGVFGFLQFLLDLSYSVLGNEKLERELEISLQPYRDILKILNVEEYLMLPEV
ncbi:hypothetical protein IAE16_04870 [Hydrogenobacter sp. T-2]|uniref:hypothetical protein n=1 Tax=Pampinifervens diazotrophicum TaxID=1632018 RepID=UPI002B25EF5E|nr:hypothetical protein [Hydrogenobacter sp. T-2]WPM33014.1 hypothetical protein IAE16_04870 [Hydrogenobacter sp. T-2]